MKACPSCHARNEERSQFCHECGERLPARPGEGGPASPTGLSVESTMVADAAPTEAPRPEPAGSSGVPTPVAPPRVPTALGECATCGFRLPPGGGARECPGCGAPIAGGFPSGRMERTSTHPFPSASPAVPEAPPRPVRVPAGWSLVVLKGGERLNRFALRRAETILGRLEGDITFPEDALLSPRHARVVLRGEQFWLEDAGSRNGVFLRLREPVELRNGDVLTFGGLVFRFKAAPATPRGTAATSEGGVRAFGSGRERARGHLVRVLQDGSDGPFYPLTPSKTVVGRKLGHFLFADDPLLSRQHLQFYERDGEMVVEDLGSSNGTLLRLRGPVVLEKGTVFRVGDVTLEVAAP